MKRFLLLLSVIALTVSCKSGSKILLPTVSGKAGEVVVVIEKSDWEGIPGGALRELLASDCPYLAQKEPLYNLTNVPPSGFTDLFRVHRNIVKFDVGSSVTSSGVQYFNDVWASPQCVIQICAPTPEEAAELVNKESQRILNSLEQAERDRVIRNSIKYEELSLAPQVKELFGGSPHFPSGYKLKKKTDNFIWIADEKQYTMQGVLIYKFPVTPETELSRDYIIARRNEVLKSNVPGMFDNTYMTTGSYFPITTEYIKYKGRDFAQTRGMWEVENDYMGGPFVLHTFYSKDGSEIINLDAFVYAPRFDKRHYLRQVESILYSWEWEN